MPHPEIMSLSTSVSHFHQQDIFQRVLPFHRSVNWTHITELVQSGHSMYVRLLRATTNWIWPFRRTGGTYRQTSIADTTELRSLTAQSNDNLSINTHRSTKAGDIKETTSERERPRSVRSYANRFAGWRFGVLNFATWASVVFLINFIVTIWGSVAHRESQSVLSEGDCHDVKTLNSGIHILINILSTILLSGSNYCMQCLSAPTRGEIDKEHAAQRWLDIGVPSLRNLRRISRRRLILWLLLGLTSLPLHLL